MRPIPDARLFLAALALAAAGGGCLKHLALNAAADAVSGSGGAYGRDDDPELVRGAVPFGLKTMEGLADQLPDHVGLRTAMARGFTQYAFAFVQVDADELEPVEAEEPEAAKATEKQNERSSEKEDATLEKVHAERRGELAARAQALRARAGRLYLRARDHGLDGLRLRHGITAEALRGPDREKALQSVEKEDVELLYWTLVPWAAAISLEKRNLQLVADRPVVSALLDRALALDEAWDKGTLHEFSLAWDSGGRPEGTTPAKLQAHFDRALELSKGKRLSLLVSRAENILEKAQDRQGFVAQLEEVKKAPIDDPTMREDRLANLLAKRRAAWLLDRVGTLFL